jgi:hypothetical protein
MEDAVKKLKSLHIEFATNGYILQIEWLLSGSKSFEIYDKLSKLEKRIRKLLINSSKHGPSSKYYPSSKNDSPAA